MNIIERLTQARDVARDNMSGNFDGWGTDAISSEFQEITTDLDIVLEHLAGTEDTPAVAILIERVRIDLLREQRDTLPALRDDNNPALSDKQLGHLDGLISLSDTMLDLAEGFPDNL